MSATIAPNAFLPGIVKFTSESDGSAVASVFAGSEDYFAVPLSAVPELGFADADPSTGDIRKIIYALEVALLTAYTALPSPNKPVKWVPRVSNALVSGGVRRSHYNEFAITYTGETLAPE